MWFTVVTVYANLYIFPHLEKDYSMNEILRLDFVLGREQIQLILGGIGGLLALLLYATSSLTEDPDFQFEFLNEMTNQNETNPVEVMSEGEATTREYCIAAVLVLIMTVLLVQSLSRKSFRWLRARLSTMLPCRIAKAYVMLLEFAILLLTATNMAYVILTVVSDDTRWMEKVRVRSVVTCTCCRS